MDTEEDVHRGKNIWETQEEHTAWRQRPGQWPQTQEPKKQRRTLFSETQFVSLCYAKFRSLICHLTCPLINILPALSFSCCDTSFHVTWACSCHCTDTQQTTTCFSLILQVLVTNRQLWERILKLIVSRQGSFTRLVLPDCSLSVPASPSLPCEEPDSQSVPILRSLG